MCANPFVSCSLLREERDDDESSLTTHIMLGQIAQPNKKLPAEALEFPTCQSLDPAPKLLVRADLGPNNVPRGAKSFRNRVPNKRP